MYVFRPAFKKSSRTLCRGGCLLGLFLLFQTANLPLLGQFGRSVQHFAQAVLNQGSMTSFTVHNPNSTASILIEIQLYDPQGDPLASRQVKLEPGATNTQEFGESEEPLTRGWAKLTSEDEFIASAFFQLVAGDFKPRVGVPPSSLSRELRVVGFVNGEFKSGIAFHNPSETDATEVTLRLKDQQGERLFEERELMIGPLESIAAFLNEDVFFGAALTNYQGTVEISASPHPVAVLSLTQEASGELATVSVETLSHYWSQTTSGSPNVLAGESSNSVSAGVVGATIGGGGSAPNQVTDHFGTVGGGVGNQAGDGLGSTSNKSFATVGGGSRNTASGEDSTVSGGQGNTASGNYSTVPGGCLNTAAGRYSFAGGHHGEALCRGCFVWAGSNEVKFSSDGGLPALDNRFLVRATGGVSFVTGIDSLGNWTAGVSMPAGGGSWSSISHREAKENFSTIDVRDVLERLSTLPVTGWNYKAQGREIRHIGPTAQEFYEAFQVGEDDRHITTVDADGVALAAIQGLYRLMQDKQAQITRLAEQNALLLERLTTLEKRFDTH